MLVKELLEIITKMPNEVLDMDIVTQGCDCDGDVSDVVIIDTTDDIMQETTDKVLYLKRTGGFNA